MKPIIILGAGGHSLVVLEVLTQIPTLKILGFTDSTLPKDFCMSGFKVLGNDQILNHYNPDDVHLVMGLGGIKATPPRAQLYRALKAQGFSFIGAKSIHAIVSKSALIDESAQLMAGCTIQANAVIKENVLINTRASIDHGCQIEPHVHIAPGATLCGDIYVGEATHIGAGAVIAQGLRIERNVTVGAGAIVLKNVPEGTTVYGNPAREK